MASFYYKPSSLTLLSLLLSCLIPSLISATTKNGGITVDLFHRDSPLLPSYSPTTTRFERLRNAFDRSFSRKSSLKSTFLKSTKQTLDDGSPSPSPSPIEATLTPVGGEYLMKISIGTPPVEQLGIADTGSDLTWTQCEPCTQCYKQNSPIFDPKTTQSYRQVSCVSDQCAAIEGSNCDGTNGGCQYQVQYGDKSYTIGDLSVETFTFTSSDNNVSFPKVVFGCGHQNEGTFSQAGSGIIGLGGGAVSIISQLDKAIGGKFSYCLTLLNSNVSSKISFGANAVVSGPDVASTRLVQKPGIATFYYLTLEGISVGSNRLDLVNYYESDSDDSISSPNSSKASSDEGNIIIDSGTTLTFLPASFYEGVEAALVKAIKGVTRNSDPKGLFKLCYELPAGGVGLDVPPITVHFAGGADVVLPEGSAFVEVEQGLVCLTIVQSNDMSIFGNLHQMNYHIGYDLVKKEVSFQPTDCAKSS